MKLRVAKKGCKRYIREMNLKIISRHGRTFVVEPKSHFLCGRYHIFIIVSKDHHEALDDLIAEGMMPIKEWKNRQLCMWKKIIQQRQERNKELRNPSK